MNRVRADLRQLDNLNLAQQCLPLGPTLKRSRATTPESQGVKASLDLAVKFQPDLGFLREPFNVVTSPPSVTVLRPATVPMGLSGAISTSSTSSNITLATGLNIDAFAVIGPVLQGGIYGSTTPELGVFGSVGGGWWTNVGVGIGPVITLIFGPPSDLEGVAFGIGCDARFMVGSLGGLLLFSPPPFRFLGIAVGLAVGPTAIPGFDVTVQVTKTFIRPLLR
ncbi:MAG: hypothetical protein ABIQ16_26370 [Polyangiaceae bacterium]